MSSHSSAGLQSLDAKLPPSHDAAATAGQRLGDRGRHHVLPARRELDLPCSDVAHSSVTACTRLCEASSIHAEETEQTRSLKLLTILPPRQFKYASPPAGSSVPLQGGGIQTGRPPQAGGGGAG